MYFYCHCNWCDLSLFLQFYFRLSVDIFLSMNKTKDWSKIFYNFCHKINIIVFYILLFLVKIEPLFFINISYFLIFIPLDFLAFKAVILSSTWILKNQDNFFAFFIYFLCWYVCYILCLALLHLVCSLYFLNFYFQILHVELTYF